MTPFYLFRRDRRHKNRELIPSWTEDDLEAASARNADAHDGLRSALLELLAARNDLQGKRRDP